MDWKLTEWGKHLVTQLSGVRIGQDDKGRIENVAGHILHFIIGDQWDNLSKHERHMLVSESAPILRKVYEGYLRHGYRTKEAAEIALKEELERLTKKYKELK
jgi:hypothetical protein